MDRPTLKLVLSLDDFDETPYLPVLEKCSDEGFQFESMYGLGDTEEHRRRLYELNRTCSRDIPARGEFFGYEEFCERRFGASYDPRGVLVALHSGRWIGMAATSNHSHKGFVFNEMTGVLHEYRRRGVAIALKLLGIRYAKSLHVRRVYTVHDFENTAAIGLNRRLGYVDVDGPRRDA